MTTGWLAWTCLLLAAGQGADDVVYLNQRGFQIPIRIQPERQAEVRELVLYVSRDQGKSWEINNRARPDKGAFDFFADRDGLLYFSVAVIDRRGMQDPPDIYKAPVGQKIHIDTMKPTVKIAQAERMADEVQVQWEVQETHPEWTSLRLEWKTNDVPTASWTPLPIEPGSRGNLRFKPRVNGDVTVRLTLKDRAGNDGTDEKTVPGGTTHHDRALAQASVVAPLATGIPGGTSVSPAPPPPPATVVSSPLTSRPPVEASTPPPLPMASSTGNVAPPSSPSPTRGSLPHLQIVNKGQVKLGFDVARCGPSGLSTVDVYVTTDEGATWEKSPVDPAVSLPVTPESHHQGPLQGHVTVQLPRDGVTYGYYLVVRSRAGLGKPPPRPGSAPLVRLERDTTQPSAELYAPQADPARGASLVLNWKAEDRNLAANPISLEWSANATGPWEFIGDAQLPNTGRFTWQVPPKTPAKVFLKLTVRDTAGNVAIAQTPEPVLIDLIEPEIGAGIRVVTSH